MIRKRINICSISLEINEFQRIVGGFISMVSDLAKQVDNEKMKVFIEWLLRT